MNSDKQAEKTDSLDNLDNTVLAQSANIEQVSVNSITTNDDKTNVIDYIDESTFDELYCKLYIITKNKSLSYKQACVLTGYEYNTKYVGQYAQSVHKRLVRDGAIEGALRDSLMNDRIAARNTINEIREYSDSENLQFQAAKHQSGDLYSSESTSAGIEVNVNRDNVQIKSGKDTLTIDNSREIKEID